MGGKGRVHWRGLMCVTLKFLTSFQTCNEEKKNKYVKGWKGKEKRVRDGKVPLIVSRGVHEDS